MSPISELSKQTGITPETIITIIEAFTKDMVRVPTFARLKGVSDTAIRGIINNPNDPRIDIKDVYEIDGYTHLSWKQYKDIIIQDRYVKGKKGTKKR